LPRITELEPTLQEQHFEHHQGRPGFLIFHLNEYLKATALAVASRLTHEQRRAL